MAISPTAPRYQDRASAPKRAHTEKTPEKGQCWNTGLLLEDPFDRCVTGGPVPLIGAGPGSLQGRDILRSLAVFQRIVPFSYRCSGAPP